jgi:hypothetical protein
MIIDYAATSPGSIGPWLMTMTCIDQNWLTHDNWHWQVQAQPDWSMLILNDNHWSKTASLRFWACAYWVIEFSDIPELLAHFHRMAPAILCQRRVLTVLVPAWAPPTTGKWLNPKWSLQWKENIKLNIKNYLTEFLDKLNVFANTYIFSFQKISSTFHMKCKNTLNKMKYVNCHF